MKRGIVAEVEPWLSGAGEFIPHHLFTIDIGIALYDPDNPERFRGGGGEGGGGKAYDGNFIKQAK